MCYLAFKMRKHACFVLGSLSLVAGGFGEPIFDFQPGELAAYLAQKAGLKLSTLVTMKKLNVEPREVYILPRPPKIEDCLSAMQGRPLTRMPKPYDSGTESSSIEGYRQAQLRVAQAKAELGIGELSHAHAVHPASELKGVEIRSFEEVPAQYQSFIYVLPQFVVHTALIPGAIFGLKYAKTAQYIRQYLPAFSGYFYLSVGFILFINVFPVSSLLGVLLAFSMGLAGSLFALRSIQSLKWLERLGRATTLLRGMEKEPFGWLVACRAFCVLCANLLYCFVSGFIPGHLGIAGMLTGNLVIAGLLYLLWLSAVSMGIFFLITSEEADARKTQNLVVAFCCSYCAVAGLSFFTNVAAIYGNTGSFVALDPGKNNQTPVHRTTDCMMSTRLVPFFSVSNLFSFNVPTLVLLSLLFIMWAAGFKMISEMDKVQAGDSLSAFSLSSFSGTSQH
ncbi:hypothetical protein TGARI_278145 [Toxoplasma gondii ARI]|uniref:Transmembrane protein n=1 Tax=Toxoplasma gondii ARI TaxID=1074872 RepID=A0A139XNY7_TOXGO|nr:hypothetical protein TGARI_278145 [Toxoplasma gondii ARI]